MSAMAFDQRIDVCPSGADRARSRRAAQGRERPGHPDVARRHSREAQGPHRAEHDLDADEATKFWPIYDQYIQETIKIGDVRWALIKDYATNYNTLTDAQAQDFIKKSGAVDQQFTALRLKYVPIFEKVISPKKTALWYQIDRRLDLLINLQLAASIPVVDTTK